MNLSHRTFNIYRFHSYALSTASHSTHWLLNDIRDTRKSEGQESWPLESPGQGFPLPAQGPGPEPPGRLPGWREGPRELGAQPAPREGETGGKEDGEVPTRSQGHRLTGVTGVHSQLGGGPTEVLAS